MLIPLADFLVSLLFHLLYTYIYFVIDLLFFIDLYILFTIFFL